MSSYSKNSAIDLFSGAGGLSLGLHMAGWDVVASYEIDSAAVETYKNNFPKRKVYCEDVCGVDFKKYQGIGLIAGGPPCQPFSVAGKQLATEDERDMIPQFVRAVQEAQPQCFIMENVPGLITKRNWSYAQQVAVSLENAGYKVSVALLHGADYGVPQKRKRIFFVGVKDNIQFKFPNPTHGDNVGRKFFTVREALRDVPPDKANKAKVVYARKPVLRKSPHAGMLVNGQGRPLELDGLSHTIPATAGGNRTHILDPKGVLIKYHSHIMNGGVVREGEVENVRRLTVRESARIQTFPDTFHFTGKRSTQYKQIGNAVPPLLAKAIGKSVYEQVVEQKSLNKQSSIATYQVRNNLIGQGELTPCQVSF